MTVSGFLRYHSRGVVPIRLQVRLRVVTPRIPTSAARVDPSFLIVGAQRAGTSSLFHALSEHPQVMAPGLKELHHFDHDRPWPHWLYRCHFPRRRAVDERAAEVGGPVVTGEATPCYLFHPDTPGRVADALPDARIVVLLREPVARAWSHLRMLNHRGWLEEQSLRAAVAQGSTTLERPRRPREHWTLPYGRFALFERGLYAEQLERWLAHFPREQILIARSEDLFDGSPHVYDDVCRFIGIAPGFIPSRARLNQGVEAPLPAADAAWLADRYLEPNRALEQLVGITWSTDGSTAAGGDAQR